MFTISRATSLAVAAAVAGAAAPPALAVEIINLRSGQVSGSPGLPGQFDDIVTYRPGTPSGPLSAVPFTAADFSGAITGPAAVVISPVSAWTPGLSDPLARWINFDLHPFSPPFGASGSALYAVPFIVTTSGITSATISLEYAVDDSLGDWPVLGGNPDGLYINGVSTGHQGAGFAAATFHNQNITGMINTGLNHLYFYQRDIGFAVSGLIFSVRITVLPTPGAAALAGMASLTFLRRRRPR